MLKGATEGRTLEAFPPAPKAPRGAFMSFRLRLLAFAAGLMASAGALMASAWGGGHG